MEKNKEDQDPIPGGGPREGEDASTLTPNPNPEAVHPDYSQTMPGEPAPASTVQEGSSKDDSDNE